MAKAFLEHVNVTVSNPKSTADRLCNLFGWHIRWQGEAIHGGSSVHVGSEDSYLALYSRPEPAEAKADSYSLRGGLNHIGVVVDDLDKTEARILEAGHKTFSHADYEPGRRFYFHDDDGIEFEVVCYG